MTSTTSPSSPPAPCRRVIFPSLYGRPPTSPTSAMTMPMIPESLNESPECKPIAEFPPLKDDDLSTARFSLCHLLPLSPLTRSVSAPPISEQCIPPPQCLLPPSVPSLRHVTKQSSDETKSCGVSTCSMRTLNRGTVPLKAPEVANEARSIFSIPLRPLRKEKPVVVEAHVEPEKPLRSILRRSGSAPNTSQQDKAQQNVVQIGSVESDLPSLADSTVSADADESSSSSPPRRHTSEPLLTSTKRCSFDPRVWVREFERSPHEKIWYTTEEMISFREEAILRIQSYTELIPTGTGRFVRRMVPPSGRAMFSHKALRLEPEVEKPQETTLASHEMIQRILLVDPHEICLKLFAKSFQQALPSVSISTAKSYQQALGHVATTEFDIILVEQRLKGSSGAILLQRLSMVAPRSLLIGVSAHLDQDALRLQLQADLVWPKPPPPMNSQCMDRLRRVLRAKRDRPFIS